VIAVIRYPPSPSGVSTVINVPLAVMATPELLHSQTDEALAVSTELAVMRIETASVEVAERT
jgi:hypothetical protein